MSAVVFNVYGEPAPQGSKTVARTGGGASFVREDNPKTEPWRNAVATEAYLAMLDTSTGKPRPPLVGPVELEVIFTFARPRSHYRTGRRAGELKPSAPHWCARRPDVDKLARALGDALSGIVVVDDAQVVKLRAEKHFGSPGAAVVVRAIVA